MLQVLSNEDDNKFREGFFAGRVVDCGKFSLIEE